MALMTRYPMRALTAKGLPSGSANLRPLIKVIPLDVVVKKILLSEQPTDVSEKSEAWR